MFKIEEIERLIGFEFHNKDLLITALTHTSYANEHNLGYVRSNERLEFLGDAILEMAVRLFLFEKYADQSEDVLTEKKKSLTNRQFLARLARNIEIDRFLLLGRGEMVTGGREKESILANVFEALIGAIYLDQGFQKVYNYIFNILPRAMISDQDFDDPKSRLNAWATKGKHTVAYRVIHEEGEPHRKFFRIEVLIDGEPVSLGQGRSKKIAEQDAARKALERLKDVI
ncbi:MAG: ribonuclease III [candidate division WOR-3 bacterium]